MPGADGLEVLRRARALDPELPVILMTAYATVPTALAAMREGAFDYVQKPFENEELVALVRRALDVTRLSRENRYLRAELRQRFALDGVVAESAPCARVLDLVRRAARGRATVLVTGETGTGKELVARALHYHSDRVAGPFVAANCRAFATGVLESELFGHERGAFTGAERARPGLFERAHGGTLFLDEIGDVDLDFQAKLLRVLQERRVRRVGGDDEREVDVRVVAATNRELRAEVDAGPLPRGSVLPARRRADRDRRRCASGARTCCRSRASFLARANAELGRSVRGFSPEVERWLRAHAWPGNVRELENAIERGVVLARGERARARGRGARRRRAAERERAAAERDGSLQDFLEHAAAERIRSGARGRERREGGGRAAARDRPHDALPADAPLRRRVARARAQPASARRSASVFWISATRSRVSEYRTRKTNASMPRKKMPGPVDDAEVAHDLGRDLARHGVLGKVDQVDRDAREQVAEPRRRLARERDRAEEDALLTPTGVELVLVDQVGHHRARRHQARAAAERREEARTPRAAPGRARSAPSRARSRRSFSRSGSIAKIAKTSVPHRNVGFLSRRRDASVQNGTPITMPEHAEHADDPICCVVSSQKCVETCRPSSTWMPRITKKTSTPTKSERNDGLASASRSSVGEARSG